MAPSNEDDSSPYHAVGKGSRQAKTPRSINKSSAQRKEESEANRSLERIRSPSAGRLAT